MKEQIIDKITQEVMRKMNASNVEENKSKEKNICGLTEFVGTGRGDTIGLVIANVDSSVHEAMNLDKKYRSIGIIGGRIGAGPQILAADEAVKATNTEILAIELARDTKGGAGHGSLIIFGAEDVADARRAVEVALKELERTFGDVYGNEAGHIEFQYTARASYACEKAFNAPVGKSFGLVVGAPAAIGVVLADTAVKAANVEVLSYSSPNQGTSFTNEVILTFTGDSGAVRQALIAAREVGIKLLGTLGSVPVSETIPYI
ncbi:microcompartment protein PduB [Parageobacillus thermoglucosidasius]|uniref:propanediol utilization microcompartment protein PduB n=1 Tax=Parageobacillus thermoglucosidasius TaxID=1426 RepID=UPI000F6285C1|nr:propanediol utilization microcompartment protein PduB [Parageobacillus thermoglucosidasius]GCD82583.1 microcompartment protein PduB [Parageobacillus thermoglucosidasius]